MHRIFPSLIEPPSDRNFPENCQLSKLSLRNFSATIVAMDTGAAR
ncbi:MAG: hypothetical protein ACK40X_06240 [Armatimonadota bacterium]